jgi:murein DD-endopeptidase MepM/ murein hydrolase activator NlpD
VKLFPGQRLVIPRADGAELTDVPPPFTQIALDAAPAQQGRTINLRITTAVPVRIEGTFMSKNLAVESDANRTSHRVVFGVFAFAQPGLYTLDLIATDDGGTQNLFRRSIEVMDGGYSSETIVLTADQNSLLDPNVTRPEADRILAMVSNVTPQRYYTGAFGLPCPAPVTSQFGTRRSYNGGPFDQMHGGTDFAGAPGSAIYAPAPGVVVMAEALNVRGNAVLIDHGWGVFTGYWHLQEIGVRVGDTVQQGQIIGTIGSTGRVTGPHLHWELFVSGVQVDPMQWVVQDFAK